MSSGMPLSEEPSAVGHQKRYPVLRVHVLVLQQRVVVTFDSKVAVALGRLHGLAKLTGKPGTIHASTKEFDTWIAC